MGWTGICIEPIAEFYEKLKTHRSCVCINGCVSNKTGPVSFLRVHGFPCALSGIIENFNEGHISRINREITKFGGSAEIISINSYDLTALLMQHNIQYIDYLSIDVEGSEMSILQSIDFNRITIDVIDVENNNNDDRFERVLIPLGYKKIAHLGVDEIYRKKENIR